MRSMWGPALLCGVARGRGGNAGAFSARKLTKLWHTRRAGVGREHVCAQVRTALNMLGPLLNPADAEYGLVGVYSTDISELMANALLVSVCALAATARREHEESAASGLCPPPHRACRRKLHARAHVAGVLAVRTRAPPQRQGVRKALVVHSAGLDELTPMAPADVVEVEQGVPHATRYLLEPKDLGIPRCEVRRGRCLSLNLASPRAS